ncbi:hypothetical protein KY284_036256 [Solanum tuberosum]|nr:hypothetical protein KY284_036256 [Solanum tuberosum]
MARVGFEDTKGLGDDDMSWLLDRFLSVEGEDLTSSRSSTPVTTRGCSQVVTPTVCEMEQNYMATFKPYTDEVKDAVIDVLKAQLKGVTILTSGVESADDEYLVIGDHVDEVAVDAVDEVAVDAVDEEAVDTVDEVVVDDVAGDEVECAIDPVTVVDEVAIDEVAGAVDDVAGTVDPVAVDVVDEVTVTVNDVAGVIDPVTVDIVDEVTCNAIDEVAE